jgi:DNA ligase-1
MTRFDEVAELAERMAATGSRLKKRAEIAAAIAAVHAVEHPTSIEKPIEMGHPDGLGSDTGRFCLYLAGLPFPESDPRKLNAGGALLTKAVLTVSGASQVELTAAYRRHGDLGAAAFDLFAGKPTHDGETVMHGAHGKAGLTLGEVAEAFAGMATAKTTAIRAALVEGLLRRATPLEAKYLLKLMLGDMRIGVKQSLVEEAIAVAAGAGVSAVRHAVMLEADLGAVAVRAFEGTLGQARMRLFHPLGFMLASPVETPEEAIERFTAKPPKPEPAKKSKRKENDPEPIAPMDAAEEGFAEDVEMFAASPTTGVQAFLEDKYDGMRAQVHCGAADQPGRVAVYSRNREDMTESYPELVEAFSGVDRELILDGEILGWEYATAQALPFAVLGQRIGRKRVGNEWRWQVPVIFMAFDLMFDSGELLLPQPLRERRKRLEGVVASLVDRVRSPLVKTERPAQASMFEAPTHHDETVMNGAPNHLSGPLPRLILAPSRLVESADEIERAYADARARANEGVMLKAAGSAYLPGRRGLAWVKLKRELATLDVVVTGTEYGHGKRAGLLSDYTFAVRTASGALENVGKAYSGVTDAEIAELTGFLKAHTLEDHGHFRTVEPLVILEVAFNNIMRSQRHASGFALRFPRILRIRTDKPLAEIDTVERVEEIYQSQVDKPVEQDKDGTDP